MEADLTIVFKYVLRIDVSARNVFVFIEEAYCRESEIL